MMNSGRDTKKDAAAQLLPKGSGDSAAADAVKGQEANVKKRVSQLASQMQAAGGSRTPSFSGSSSYLVPTQDVAIQPHDHSPSLSSSSAQLGSAASSSSSAAHHYVSISGDDNTQPLTRKELYYLSWFDGSDKKDRNWLEQSVNAHSSIKERLKSEGLWTADADDKFKVVKDATNVAEVVNTLEAMIAKHPWKFRLTRAEYMGYIIDDLPYTPFQIVTGKDGIDSIAKFFDPNASVSDATGLAISSVTATGDLFFNVTAISPFKEAAKTTLDYAARKPVRERWNAFVGEQAKRTMGELVISGAGISAGYAALLAHNVTGAATNAIFLYEGVKKADGTVIMPPLMDYVPIAGQYAIVGSMIYFGTGYYTKFSNDDFWDGADYFLKGGLRHGILHDIRRLELARAFQVVFQGYISASLARAYPNFAYSAQDLAKYLGGWLSIEATVAFVFAHSVFVRATATHQKYYLAEATMEKMLLEKAKADLKAALIEQKTRGNDDSVEAKDEVLDAEKKLAGRIAQALKSTAVEDITKVLVENRGVDRSAQKATITDEIDAEMKASEDKITQDVRADVAKRIDDVRSEYGCFRILLKAPSVADRIGAIVLVLFSGLAGGYYGYSKAGPAIGHSLVDDEDNIVALTLSTFACTLVPFLVSLRAEAGRITRDVALNVLKKELGKEDEVKQDGSASALAIGVTAGAVVTSAAGRGASLLGTSTRLEGVPSGVKSGVTWIAINGIFNTIFFTYQKTLANVKNLVCFKEKKKEQASDSSADVSHDNNGLVSEVSWSDGSAADDERKTKPKASSGSKVRLFAPTTSYGGINGADDAEVEQSKQSSWCCWKKKK